MAYMNCIALSQHFQDSYKIKVTVKSHRYKEN